MSLPLVEELPAGLDAETAFVRLACLPHCVFLDSALQDSELGRYSFVAADPFEYWQSGPGDAGGLRRLEQRLSQLEAEPINDLPPFQGGAAGLFSYDLGRSLERLPAARWDEFQVPGLAVGLYDVVLAFDHQSQRAWLVSQGFPEKTSRARRERAADRLRQLASRLTAVPTAGLRSGGQPARLRCEELAPQFPVASMQGLSSDFTEPGYLAAVKRAIDYIYAGDVFQVNLSQRLLYPADDDAVSLYCRLRRCNPATFAAYFDLGGCQILSASPERFVRVHEDLVEARPIKGTRQRTASPEADLYAAEELLQSEKDRAENVMIVDLLRNDLSRVCRPDSVQVTQLCHLEVYQFVQHLVSAVCGQLAVGRTPIDVVRAAFPGGSITGAPKVRAMQIIAELEPTVRGAYCGSLGYIGFDGATDLSILIRTITAARGWWQFPVGGGIVAQSNPRLEYEETWHKATGMLRGPASFKMILLIDNYDSFVYNLARYFERLGQATYVVRNDATDADQIRRMSPSALVLSPGPCTPTEAGCSLDVVRQLHKELPILGVCLGHQTIAAALGGSLGRAREPMHGRTSQVRHDRRGLFEAAPNPLTVCRYHSLVVNPLTLPKCLRATSWTLDGVLMSLEHRNLPVFGVQFHPESILAEAGVQQLGNFLRLAGLEAPRRGTGRRAGRAGST